jgi:hypothetical protein
LVPKLAELARICSCPHLLLDLLRIGELGFRTSIARIRRSDWKIEIARAINSLIPRRLMKSIVRRL